VPCSFSGCQQANVLSLDASFIQGGEDMTEIRKQDEVLETDALASCKVHWVDTCNAQCLVHKPECNAASAFGNYCEHPEVLLIRDTRLLS